VEKSWTVRAQSASDGRTVSANAAIHVGSITNFIITDTSQAIQLLHRSGQLREIIQARQPMAWLAGHHWYRGARTIKIKGETILSSVNHE
jgi:hypothetical protein